MISKRQLYRILLAAGALILIAGAVAKAVGIAQDYLAGQRAERLLLQVLDRERAAYAAAPVPSAFPAASLLRESPDAPDTVAAGYTPPDYDTIGVLSIPAIDVTLPVLSLYGDDLLKVSPCRYEGEIFDGKPYRLVIAGHNYNNHFGRLSKLAAGDEVVFRACGGDIDYRVLEITEIGKDDRDALESGVWDITLLTCNRDWSKRVLVRCEVAESAL